MLGRKYLLIGALSLGLLGSAPAVFAKDGGVCKPDVEKFCKKIKTCSRSLAKIKWKKPGNGEPPASPTPRNSARMFPGARAR
jgi:hypothetical protein